MDAPLPAIGLDQAEPLMRAEGIGVAFHGHAALADVHLQVHAGELVAVLGPSGAGKTTLFRCLAGLARPDGGRVRVDGQDITGASGRNRRRMARGIALVFQQFNLVGRLTALDNVLAGRLGHVPAWRGWLRRFSRADRLLALECLDRVGLLAKAGQRADSLSGGQQQRVAIARALAQRPRLILADEPVASLDPATAAGVLDLLRGIARADGVGVVCSLHQVDLARAAADRIIGLADGRVVVDLPAASFDTAAADRLYGTP
ncbi:phosphonate ABC transporter ATP-binding protein [Nitrospirillum sp. BR 11828]|uniref:phosphonate ABC transporter ATP-binding protein n=1 Tax=Nitrospirillum sp. BR 11828 TaxID=3104325 RepID=UPI002ACAEAEE|nr:phosphonate ABC transporter ATP-binding protein [Nitrospirillum sp. BR 11828]MDZ5645560.1 phosphonate ABC transporter ATP-binding protein [Nitrospirillum sp. BR 11828]